MTIFEKVRKINMTDVLLGLVATFGLWVIYQNVNSCCIFVAHQPELQKEAMSMRKF